LKNSFRPLLPDVRFLTFNDFKDLSKITERSACVIVESVQAEAGIILPAPDYLKMLKQRCVETGTFLILDDVQMGFGRTGKLFSFENYDFVPDILTIAKGMGGGMPIGAFVASKEIMTSLTFEPELGHITTFGGHPVCCAAAIANLSAILDENILDSIIAKGEAFINELQQIKSLGEIRSVGLMLGIDLESVNEAENVVNKLLQNGLITDRFLFRPEAFRIAPPLNITYDEIEIALFLIKKSLGA
jgi:acetylornithine/N-succinyldiaminopimelate aminotransferase